MLLRFATALAATLRTFAELLDFISLDALLATGFEVRTAFFAILPPLTGIKFDITG